VSRTEYAKSYIDGKSVNLIDSGEDKTVTSRKNTKIFKIITYNVRILQTKDSFEMLEEEFKKYQVEHHWKYHLK
jgi:hypothetical protein